MNFGKVSHGSYSAVVEQVVKESIPMLVSKGLHGSIKFQASLVVVSEHQLEVLDPGAEGGGGQGRSSMSQ